MGQCQQWDLHCSVYFYKGAHEYPVLDRRPGSNDLELDFRWVCSVSCARKRDIWWVSELFYQPTQKSEFTEYAFNSTIDIHLCFRIRTDTATRWSTNTWTLQMCISIPSYRIRIFTTKMSNYHIFWNMTYLQGPCVATQFVIKLHDIVITKIGPFFLRTLGQYCNNFCYI